MDRIDQKILEVLSADSALTSERLGERVGLSPSAAHRRVRMLEEGGAILGYRARLSRAARGNPSTVFVSVTLVDQRRDTLQAFEAALADCPVVQEAHLMSGEFDYLLKVAIRASDSYEQVHREILAALPGVQRLVTHFSIKAVLTQE